MKKLKLIFMLISALLVLLSSGVLATTINLNDLKVYYDTDSYSYDFYILDASGNKINVTQEELMYAVEAEGYEVYGYENVYAYIEYSDSNGELKTFNHSSAWTEPFDWTNDTWVSSMEVNDYLFDYDMLDTRYNEYEDYFTNSNHELYFSIYVNDGVNEELVLSTDISYDTSTYENAFQAHCDSRSDELGRTPTLQDFLDYYEAPPAHALAPSNTEIYTLYFSNINETKEIPREQVWGVRNEPVMGYKTNGMPLDVYENEGEILFKVTQSGTYFIDITYTEPSLGGAPLNQNSQRLIYLAKNDTDLDGNPIFCSMYAYKPREVSPIMQAGKEKTGETCIDDECVDNNVPVGEYYDKAGYYPLVKNQVYAIATVGIRRL